MKCERCPALVVGYDYEHQHFEPECSIESLTFDYMTDDGCTMNHNKIKKLVKEIKEK